MTAPANTPWGPLAIAALMMLVFLYSKSNNPTEAGYLQEVASLRQLQELNSQSELDALRTRMGVVPHYDRLTGTAGELGRMAQALKLGLGSRIQGSGDAVDPTLLAEALEKKIEVIEKFKSSNSLLRNSLAFLPMAATDLLRTSVSPSPASARTPTGLAADVNRVLLSTMLYSQAPSDEGAAHIFAELRARQSGMSLLSPLARERLALFDAHVRTVVREQRNVDHLLQQITATGPADRINAIHQVLDAEQQEAASESGQYRSALLVFAVVLVLLLLYSAYHLLLSARVSEHNRKLQLGNKALERRVMERTQELQRMQAELVDTARRAGMAEIATNVLHNVGNILNSVNVSGGLVSGMLRRSRGLGLSRAVELMKAHDHDLGAFLTVHDKGRLLPAYLVQVATALEQERAEMTEELKHLMSSVDHIKDVVSTQQSHAGGQNVIELVKVADLAEDALRMNGSALVGHHIKVVKEVAEVPPVRLDRGRVLQILINLISNARQAMDAGAGNRANLLVLRLRADGQRLWFSVQDDGEGIPPDNLTRIFSHGFTTRPTGHGFGLHSCALAAKQMGGTLTAHSDGPGRGAIFTLELPMNIA